MVVEFEDLRFEAIVTYKPQNRHTYYRMRDGALYINSNHKITQKDIERIVKENYSFIKKHLSSQKAINNHQIHILGKAYDFKAIEAMVDDAYIKDDMIYILAKRIEYGYLKKLIDRLKIQILRDYAANHYTQIFSRFDGIISQMPSLEYKTLKSCYGRYEKKRNTIVLSSILCQYEPKYIDLVICHELCHTIYMDHQTSFYKLFNSVFPNAKSVQHQLRKTKYNDYF